jgi:acetyl esterase/lipase
VPAFTASDFHPDLRKIARLTPKQSVTPVTLPIMRLVTRRMWRRAPEDVEALTLPSGVGVWLYRPTGATGPGPALLWIHGGGYVIGHPGQDDALCRRYARRLGATVASVD